MPTPQASGRDVEVVGPITGARPPFGVPRVDVSDRGYVVEEFQIAGTAAAFVAAGDAPARDRRSLGAGRGRDRATTSPACS